MFWEWNLTWTRLPLLPLLSLTTTPADNPLICKIKNWMSEIKDAIITCIRADQCTHTHTHMQEQNHCLFVHFFQLQCQPDMPDGTFPQSVRINSQVQPFRLEISEIRSPALQGYWKLPVFRVEFQSRSVEQDSVSILVSLPQLLFIEASGCGHY